MCAVNRKRYNIF